MGAVLVLSVTKLVTTMSSNPPPNDTFHTRFTADPVAESMFSATAVVALSQLGGLRHAVLSRQGVACCG